MNKFSLIYESKAPSINPNKFKELSNLLSEYEKVADEVIEDYYNDLYDNDPPYGTILEHPSKFRKTPSFTIRRKKKKRTI